MVIYILFIFILYVFIKKYGQKAFAYLAEKTNWPPTVGYLNPYLGVFRIKDKDIAWHIVYSLSPLSKGTHYFQEWIEIQEGDNHIDGLQSYLLKPDIPLVR